MLLIFEARNLEEPSLMTQKTGRKRGRPPGAGIDDAPRLQKIAALMAADPKLRLTTAIKKSGVYDPTPISRLRRKWKKEGERLLAEAREKARRAAAPARSGGYYSGSGALAAVLAGREHKPLGALVGPYRESLAELAAPRSYALWEATNAAMGASPLSHLLEANERLDSMLRAHREVEDRLARLQSADHLMGRALGWPYDY